MPLPIVAIVGRPNVGKSSLFNRLIHRRLAVVDSVSGVTRDRNISLCEWRGKSFHVVDTGGMVPGTDDLMEQLILDQAQMALEQADLVVLVVDCQTGLTDIDARIWRELVRSDTPVIVAVNKADNERLDIDANSFYSLGVDKIFSVSAISGRGIGDLLDEIVERMPEIAEKGTMPEGIRVAVVGRPNVGKSSFVNHLLGEQRQIVSDIPGTTRDAIDTQVTIDGRQYVLIDTAGLRKRSRIKESVEFYTSLRTLRAIERCDVAIILLDANEGLNFQELKIIEEVGEAERGMVLAVNKWDIFDKIPESVDIYVRQIKEAVPTYDYIPTIFVSALTGQRVAKALTLVDRVYEEYTRRIGTSELNTFLAEAVSRQTPAAIHGKWVQLFYMTQPETKPPVFIIFSNHPELIQESYKRYLSNQLRERFGLVGVPFRLKFKGRSQKSTED